MKRRIGSAGLAVVEALALQMADRRQVIGRVVGSALTAAEQRLRWIRRHTVGAARQGTPLRRLSRVTTQVRNHCEIDQNCFHGAPRCGTDFRWIRALRVPRATGSPDAKTATSTRHL